jgi:acyl dehydratase
MEWNELLENAKTKGYNLQGSIKLTKEEIIAFAKNFDPLYFHIDPEKAQKSIFKKLVASGPHPYLKIYKNYFIPFVGHTIMGGLGIDNWRFLKPVFPEESIFFHIKIKEFVPNFEKNSVTITWHTLMTDQEKNTVQYLDTIVLHQLYSYEK